MSKPFKLFEVGDRVEWRNMRGATKGTVTHVGIINISVKWDDGIEANFNYVEENEIGPIWKVEHEKGKGKEKRQVVSKSTTT